MQTAPALEKPMSVSSIRDDIEIPPSPALVGIVFDIEEIEVVPAARLMTMRC